MDEPRPGTVGYLVSVSATATVAGDFNSVNDLERAVLEATRAAGRQLHARAFAALQDGWLAAHRHRITAQRWRTLQWLTPFGPVALPVRLVREKASGRYFTLSKVLLRHKATRRVDSGINVTRGGVVDKAAATQQNYRPAARAHPAPRQARLGRCRVKYRSRNQPPLQTPRPKLESPPCRTPAPTQTTPGPALSLEGLVESQTPISSQTPPALISPQLTIDKHYHLCRHFFALP